MDAPTAVRLAQLLADLAAVYSAVRRIEANLAAGQESIVDGQPVGRWAKEMTKGIWDPVMFDEPLAERTTSPLGPIVLADMEDAEKQWDAIVAPVSPEKAAHLEADRAHHKEQMCDATSGAAFAVLGTDTVEKIRTAVYKRVAASCLELQVELLERFGAANEGFLQDIWAGIDIEAGCGLVFTRRYHPFHEAAYQENLRTMDADHAAATEYEPKKGRAAEPTTE